MNVLRRSLKDFLELRLDDDGLERLEWRDFGTGLSMARLAREGARELVLYRIRADADPSAFLRHEHVQGEVYLVLRGRIVDESGVYSEMDLVYLDPGSIHSPRAEGETVVLVLWPAGVKMKNEE